MNDRARRGIVLMSGVWFGVVVCRDSGPRVGTRLAGLGKAGSSTLLVLILMFLPSAITPLLEP